MKKIVAVLLTLVLVFLSSAPLYAADFKDEDALVSEYIAVYNVEKKRVVFAKNADVPTAPGATAKLMTAVLALEYFGGIPDKNVTVTPAATRGLEGSAVLGKGLKAGEEISVRDLLYALMVAGANDAANVLAIEVAGSIPEFVKQMNRKAASLGATETVYLNATGLDALGARTTAEDAAIIAGYAYQNASLMALCSTRSYTVPATNLHNAVTLYTKNFLLSTQYGYYDATAEGMTVGYTDNAGWTIVSARNTGAYPYVCVSMQSQKDDAGKIGAYHDVRKLLAWASDNFADRKLLDASKIMQESPVLGGRANHVLLVPAESLYAFLDKDIDLSRIEITQELQADTLTAPVAKGTVVGTAHLLLDGKEIASVPLITRNAVKKSGGKNVLLFLGRVLRSPFLWSGIAIIAASAALVLHKRKQK